MLRNFAVSLAALFLVPLLLMAQDGKIRGKVTDKETGEPLIGANVTVEGTSLGAATDVNGEYVIVSIGVGTYTMKVNYVGYQAVTVSNVVVSAGLTSEQNFALSSTSIAAPAVEIVAKRPLINKSATNSVRIVDADFIQNLPQRGINASIDLQPGVVDIGGNFYIRGGRSDETAFTLEGAPITNVIGGGRGVTIIDAALEQVQVLAGGYGAEYGGANAGIIRSQLKSGGQQFNATLQAESDDYTGQGKRSLGGYSYGYRDITATAGGPIADRLKFFLSYQNTYYKDPAARFWDGFNFPNQVTLATATPASPNAPVIDTINMSYPAGNFLGGFVQNNNFAGTLGADLGTVQVRLAGSYAHRNGQNQAGEFEMLDQKRLGLYTNNDGFANLKLTQFLNTSTFYELNANYTVSTYETYDPDFGSNLFAYGDSAANAAKGYSLLRDGTGYNAYFIALGPGKYTVGSQTAADFLGSIAQPGTPLVGYSKGKTQSLGARLDFTSQMTSSFEVKVGGEYTRYTYRTFNPANILNWATLKNQGITGDSLYRRLLGFHPNDIGYDVYGNEISGDLTDAKGQLTDLAPRHPVFAAGYVQTKTELSDIVVNAGFRYDFIDSDGQDLLNPKFIYKDSSGQTDLIRNDQLLKTANHSYVSPRIGFSFPASDKTVFHAGYGKYVQQPRLGDAYRGIASMSQIVNGGNFFANTTGYNLRPERTTQYEIGFSQLLSDNSSLDITAFYKDIVDQLQYVQILPLPNSPSGAFPEYQNGDFATTRGLEFKFTMRRTNRVQMNVNYTLSDAEGTGSASNTLAGAVVTTGQIPKFVFPNEFNQTHRGNISLDYRYGKGDGGPVLEQAGVNLLLNFNSGQSFTRISNTQQSDADPRSRTPLEAVGASSTGWFFQLDGRIDKAVQFGPVNADIYVYVINILNRANPVSVFRKTGSPSEDGWLGSLYGQNDAASFGTDQATYEAMYRSILLGHNPANYGPPRQIRFGVRLEY